MKYIFGADIGGTTIKLGLFNDKLNILETWTINTDFSTNAETKIFSDIKNSCVQYMEKYKFTENDLLGIGIGIPAPVIEKRYLASDCANLNIKANVDIKNLLGFNEKIKVSIENDANMATIGEYISGAGNLCENLMFLTIGTGIGCGVISNGNLITGVNGAAGEIGHILIPNIYLEDFSDTNLSEFEHITSGVSLEKLAYKFLKLDKYKDSILNKLSPTPKNIFDNPNDILAKKLIEIHTKYFALGLSYACSITNPQKIILGGGMSAANGLVENIKKYFNEFTYSSNKKGVDIEISTLGNQAGIIGCAASILLEYYDNTYLHLMHILNPENVHTNVKGKDITTFKIGGDIKYFVTPATIDQLQNLLKFCKKTQTKFFVIGNGSNVLVDDSGYNGIIISLKNMDIPTTINNNKLTVSAAMTLKELSEIACDNCISGFEFYHDIPGSVGGGITMNCGAYNGETKDIIISATLLNKDGELIELSNTELKLSYRHSILKDDNYIVIKATFEGVQKSRDEIINTMDELYKKRIEKQPLEYPSAGSVFKRPVGHFAGKLIMDCNLMGFRIGNAMVSTKHAGFIINLGEASSNDVTTLIKYIISKVNIETGVTLEPEVIILK